MGARNPAPFNDEVLAAVNALLLDRLPRGRTILDPFAGSGRIHDLRPYWRTYGVELEPEWVVHEPTAIGSVLELPQVLRSNRFPKRYDAIVTSPTFGNRMADHHDARERCKACSGTGQLVAPGSSLGSSTRVVFVDCRKCAGKGYREYKRITYKHQLGRDLTPGNSGEMQWGVRYREFHEQAWTIVVDVLDEGGWFVLDISDHYRDDTRQLVSSFHVATLCALGLTPWAFTTIPVPRMGFGANRSMRTEGHLVALFRKAHKEFAA